MKHKRITALIAAFALTAAVIAGCGSADSGEGSGTASSQTSQKEETEEVVHLEMAIPFFGTSAPADAGKIEEKINEIAQREVGVNVHLSFYSVSDYYAQIPLMLSGDEQLDCLVTFSDMADSWMSKGYLQPFTSQMETYGEGIREVLGEEWLAAGQYDGEQYELGVRTDLVEAICFVMRKDIVEECGVDLSSVKEIADMGKVFEAVKEKEPELIPMVANNAQEVGAYQFGIDILFDTLGVLQTAKNPQGTEIVNFFATDEYREYCELMHEWYQKGYIEKDVLTETENGAVLVQNGKAFGFLYPYKPYVETQETQLCGYEMVSVELSPPVCSTSTLVSMAWTIGRNCVDVDKAVQFYNLCYTNRDILNLLAWGIEGEHYVLDENGQATLPEGVNADESGYNLGMGWLFFDNFNQYVAAGNPPDLYEAIDKFNKTAQSSTAMGFHWNAEEVKTEVAACTAVLQQYRPALEYGVVNPDEILPEFLSKLEDSGIDKVIAAKQKQFDEWRERNAE